MRHLSMVRTQPEQMMVKYSYLVHKIAAGLMYINNKSKLPKISLSNLTIIAIYFLLPQLKSPIVESSAINCDHYVMYLYHISKSSVWGPVTSLQSVTV